MPSHVSEWPLVVVCEPDDAALESLCDHLTADRFNVLPAPTASDALRLCRYHQPDLMVLNPALPDAPGLGVLREIRQSAGGSARSDPRLPIVILAAQGGSDDRVRALDEGADDYLERPCHHEELRARISAVLRRVRAPKEGLIRVGEIVVDPAGHKVTIGDREVSLTKKEFTFLRVLASDPTRVFSKAELADRVWGRELDGSTRTLDSHASRLRRKLDPLVGRYVVNCWGVGYRLTDD